MEQEELKKECLEYFRARQVYQKLFEGMRKNTPAWDAWEGR